MTIKEYFYQAFSIDGLIKSNRLEVERLRSLISFTPALDLTKPLVKSQSQKTYLEDTVSLIVALENEVLNDINRCVRLKKQIRLIINDIDDLKLKAILQKRYVELKTWHEIAVETNYTTRQVTNLHGQALAVAEKVSKKHFLLFL